MIAKEKLKLEHPELYNDDDRDNTMGCPDQYGYLQYDSEICNRNDCHECWAREIPETLEEKLATIPEVEPDEIDKQMIIMAEKEKEMTTKKTKAELIEEINKLKEDLVKLEKYSQYDKCADEFKAIHDSFVRVGFTEEQAFTLLITSMKTQKK